jgi:RNA polymerase sigma-70 factor (ECF subfamily)
MTLIWPRSLRGWLFRVARNLLYDHYQMPVTTGDLDEELPAPPEEDVETRLMRTLDAERVQRALRMLATDQQEVLVLRFGQMMSLQDTADSMGKSVSAIKSLQFRAIDALRRLLSEPEAEYGVL